MSVHDPSATQHKEAQEEEEKKIVVNENATVSQTQDPAPVQPDRPQKEPAAATNLWTKGETISEEALGWRCKMP